MVAAALRTRTQLPACLNLLVESRAGLGHPLAVSTVRDRPKNRMSLSIRRCETFLRVSQRYPVVAYLIKPRVVGRVAYYAISGAEPGLPSIMLDGAVRAGLLSA